MKKQSFTFKKLASVAALIAVGAVSSQSIFAQGIDVVFKIDESGSMGGDISDVAANVITIFNALPMGSHVGLVGYGQGQLTHTNNALDQHAHVHTAMTDDMVAFTAAVNEMAAWGSIERGYLAVVQSASDIVYGGQLGFTGAPYCNILITDETADQGGATVQEAIDAMNARNNGVFFGIGEDGSARASLQPIADATGGMTFSLADFRTDATPVLEAVIAACVEAVHPVLLDIKPESCPNPFKLRQRGVMPIAILGSDTFDVASIDPESVELHVNAGHVPGCEPIRWEIEDVATPYDGESTELDENNCTELGADGYADLTMKFDSQCLAAAAGGDTGVVLWEITGQYDDAGTPTDFVAEDVVRVMK